MPPSIGSCASVFAANPLQDDNSLESYCFDLPEELIAQAPAYRRDASRLLVVDRHRGVAREAHFTDLPELLPPGALLVVNNSKVLPARLLTRKDTGGAVEFLMLTPLPLVSRARTVLRTLREPPPGARAGSIPGLRVRPTAKTV